MVFDFKSIFFRSFIFSLIYGVLFYALQFFFVRIGMLGIEPDTSNLLLWDAWYYYNIAEEGYLKDSHNTGFFILFPLIWKLSHLSVWGICALNVILFSVGFGVLCKMYAITDKKIYLLWLTLPPIYFAFLPYTEALFFLLGSLSLYALSRKRYGWLWLCLFLLSLVRVTAVFLTPALIYMELVSNSPKDWYKSLVRALLRYITPIFLALGLFILWQYYETGIWMAYFKKQSTHWGHVFSWPGIPFSNIEGGDVRYHWLSALGMFIHLLAFVSLTVTGIKWLKGEIYKDNIFIFSAGYLFMVLLSIIFMNPKYAGSTTNIMGVMRYTFVTPFFFVFLQNLLRRRYTTKEIWYTFIFLHAFWVLFGAYHELDRYIQIAFVNNLLVIAFMLYTSKEKYSWLIIPVIAFNFFTQIHFFQQFITPLYMD